MSENKAGLHKNVSAIFDGVPIPENSRARQGLQSSVVNDGEQVKAESATAIQEPPAVKELIQPVETTAKIPGLDEQSPQMSLIEKAPSQSPLQKIGEIIKEKILTPAPGVSPVRQIAMTILVPVLFIVMSITFFKVFKPSSQKKTKPTQSQAAEVVADTAEEPKWEIPEPYPQTLRDPMLIDSGKITQEETSDPTVIKKETVIKKSIVKGIVYSKGNASALINRQIMHVGDEVSGATITKINKDSVEFEMNGKKWIQKIHRQ